jgi:Family of unknown function (DUF5694)
VSFQRIFGLIAVLLCLAVGLWAQSACAGKPQILVLGTYHMANPGHDLYNMQVDDVRAPKRQQELAQLADVLAKFAPNKIAIEADPDSKRIPTAYKDYVAGKHELTQNEIEQVGFRLGKQLGHEQMFPIDVDGEFPMQRVMNYAKANGRSADLDKLMASIGQTVAQQDEYVKSHTVLQTLLYMNSPEQVAANNTWYMQLAAYGEPGDFAGPDLLAAWYTRNIRIHNNLVKLIQKPTDRILVIYGSGHLGWMQENVKLDSNLCLRTLAEFAATN